MYAAAPRFFRLTQISCRICAIFILVLLCMPTLAQKPETSRWKYYPQMSFMPHAGYAWQGINTIEAGLRLFTLGVHENFSVIGNIIIFRQNVTYASPEVKLRYCHLFRTGNRIGLFGIAPAVSYWTTKVQTIREHRITPEIALVVDQRVDLYYGYNIPVSKTTIDFISENRIGIRFIVD